MMEFNPRIWRTDIPNSTNPLRFFAFVSRPHWRASLLAAIGVVTGSTLLTMVSYIFRGIANAVAVLPAGSYEPLFFKCGQYVLVLLLGNVAYRMSGFAGGRWATGARATARYALSAYVTLHSRTYFSNRFAGSLANKVSHASNGIRQMVEQSLWQFLDLTVAVVASFIIAFLAMPLLGWIFFGWVVFALALNIYFARRRIPLSSTAQELETRLNGITVDLLSNITTMQEYARRIFELDHIQSVTNERRVAGLRNWYYGDVTLLLNGIVQALFGGAMALAAVYFARMGQIAPVDIILILTLIFRIEGLLLSLGGHLNGFAENWGEIKESLEEILQPHEIPDRQGAGELVIRDPSIMFHDVTFGFAGEPVFRHLTLAIPAGQRVGLVGRSGAGKSTLMRLILRHHDIGEGSIRIGGQNITDVTLESLRRSISVVPQEPLLFHRTILENIRYGRPRASEADIIQAAKLAHAHDFIERLHEGYSSLVGERGVKLSGGERQRIAIARAILKDAPILLMDEATSALDSESEVEIQKALAELMRGKTVIAIAHRLSTLREMDRILVMDRGAIVEEGTHDQLVERGGIYAELWSHQVGGFLKEVAA